MSLRDPGARLRRLRPAARRVDARGRAAAGAALRRARSGARSSTPGSTASSRSRSRAATSGPPRTPRRGAATSGGPACSPRGSEPAVFLVDHFLNGSPASYLLFAACRRHARLLTLCAACSILAHLDAPAQLFGADRAARARRHVARRARSPPASARARACAANMPPGTKSTATVTRSSPGEADEPAPGGSQQRLDERRPHVGDHRLGSARLRPASQPRTRTSRAAGREATRRAHGRPGAGTGGSAPAARPAALGRAAGVGGAGRQRRRDPHPHVLRPCAPSPPRPRGGRPRSRAAARAPGARRSRRRSSSDVHLDPRSVRRRSSRRGRGPSARCRRRK